MKVIVNRDQQANLTELKLSQRILRRENFLVALLNSQGVDEWDCTCKKVGRPYHADSCECPVLKLSYFPKQLEKMLLHCIIDPIFSQNSHLAPMYTFFMSLAVFMFTAGFGGDWWFSGICTVSVAASCILLFALLPVSPEDARGLRNRFIVAGLLNAVLMPFALMFLVVDFFVKVGNLFISRTSIDVPPALERRGD
jgi:hypothetical protein